MRKAAAGMLAGWLDLAEGDLLEVSYSSLAMEAIQGFGLKDISFCPDLM